MSATEQPNILVVEDEPEVRDYLQLCLQCRGYAVSHAENGDEALNMLKDEDRPDFSLVLLDIMMPRLGGMDTLRGIRTVDRHLPVVMLSAVGGSATIVEAMKSGADDFLTKPVRNDQLVGAIQRVLESRKSGTPVDTPVQTARRAAESTGRTWMSKVETLLRRVGASDAPVLLNGETGSGKEVLARMLHSASPRAARPLLKVNCAALPSELIESELFGYEKGAFTGAFKSKPGKFDLADRGTILLDEIGDMDFRLQAKLLQVLQDHEFQRVGGSETIRVNVRVMAATHTDLEKAIAEGRFREDLYYRLNVINIHVPPLRERPDEILSLAEGFLTKYGGAGGLIELTPELREALVGHHWPGNVRELENFIRKYLVLQDPEAAVDELTQRAKKARGGKPAPAPSPVTSFAPPMEAPEPLPHGKPPVPATLDQVSEAQRKVESAAILNALERTRWNRKQAAVLLGVDYKALLYKLKKLGIDAPQAEGAGA